MFLKCLLLKVSAYNNVTKYGEEKIYIFLKKNIKKYEVSTVVSNHFKD